MWSLVFGHGIVNLEFTFPCQVSGSPVYMRKIQFKQLNKTNQKRKQPTTKETNKQNQSCIVCGGDVGGLY